MTNLRLLLDTNITIPLEPTSSADLESGSPEVVRLVEMCQRAGVKLYLHPAAKHDLARDKNEERRRTRTLLFGKYPALEDPPPVSPATSEIVGDAEHGSNDWVDNCLLEALSRSCVHFLVSEDRGLHRKARRLGLKNVLTTCDALAVVQRLFDKEIHPPPAVKNVFVYSLDFEDTIFDSFREDYQGFEVWLRKCSEKHRKAWVIEQEGRIAAFSIYKEEDGTEIGLEGKTLKLCSFKVADQFRGLALGELLLRSAYSHARANSYKWIYLTAFAEKQEFLLAFLEEFGFEQLPERNKNGEVLMAKPVGWQMGLPKHQEPTCFLRRYGPFSFKRDDVSAFIVPIQPEYHFYLFPDTEAQQDLFPGRFSFGNSLRKAYLCNASIRFVRPGDVVFFYKSGGHGTIEVVGIVEDSLVSSEAADVAAFVGKRTVYRYEEIEKLAGKREVLSLLFLTVRTNGVAVGIDELVEHKVILAAPQSIQSIPKEAYSWLLNRMQF